jgi:hypothetical protein
MSQTNHGRDTVVARRIMARTYWNVRKMVRDCRFGEASNALQSMAYILDTWSKTDESWDSHGTYAENYLGQLFLRYADINEEYSLSTNSDDVPDYSPFGLLMNYNSFEFRWDED